MSSIVYEEANEDTSNKLKLTLTEEIARMESYLTSWVPENSDASPSIHTQALKKEKNPFLS